MGAGKNPVQSYHKHLKEKQKKKNLENRSLQRKCNNLLNNPESLKKELSSLQYKALFKKLEPEEVKKLSGLESTYEQYLIKSQQEQNQSNSKYISDSEKDDASSDTSSEDSPVQSIPIIIAEETSHHPPVRDKDEGKDADYPEEQPSPKDEEEGGGNLGSHSEGRRHTLKNGQENLNSKAYHEERPKPAHESGLQDHYQGRSRRGAGVPPASYSDVRESKRRHALETNPQGHSQYIHNNYPYTMGYHAHPPPPPQSYNTPNRIPPPPPPKDPGNRLKIHAQGRTCEPLPQGRIGRIFKEAKERQDMDKEFLNFMGEINKL